MVLNKRQMSNLFNAINSNNFAMAGGGNTSINVAFTGSINASNPNEANKLVNMVAEKLANKFKRQI
jgi:hypothetical protein